ncbi:MAG TPA: hypothetical protein G4N92_00715 [Anaerolineae bacterium]|nr:hypothetical protein [Anaerolineae bacterium]
MSVHLYLSLLPEALIASMLTPEEFGVYYAVGSLKKSRGQAIFFELAPTFRSKAFPINEGLKRCVPHEDGTPKRSIYISVYRVLEHVPVDALQKLHLVTQDGRILGLEKAKMLPEDDHGLHLYREIAPVPPLVVSTLGPEGFFDLIVRNPASLVKLPAICFAELKLGNLAEDPQLGEVEDLPYANIFHLRDCLLELRTKKGNSKMVDRTPSGTIAYRTIKNGLFVGNAQKLLYYPIPSQDELIEKHYSWWRSASM